MLLHTSQLTHRFSTLPLLSPHRIILIVEALEHIMCIHKSMRDLLALFTHIRQLSHLPQPPKKIINPALPFYPNRR